MHGEKGDGLANNSLDGRGVISEGMCNFGELILIFEFMILVGRLFV